MTDSNQYSELDRLFEDARERLESGKVNSSSPYKEGPLASDHFMLKKSWDYFHHRVTDLNDQNDTLLASKTMAIESLTKELEETRNRLEKLEEDHRYFSAFQEELRQEWTGDFLSEKHALERLKNKWEEERVALESRTHDLEYQLEKKTYELKLGSDLFRKLENDLRAHIQLLKEEQEKSADRQHESVVKIGKELNESAETIKDLHNKIDLMRTEIDRRDQLLQQLEAVRLKQDKRIEGLLLETDELNKELQRQRDAYNQLDLTNNVLRQEMENMRRIWEEEKAEWRELWDRERETWERHRKE